MNEIAATCLAIVVIVIYHYCIRISHPYMQKGFKSPSIDEDIDWDIELYNL